MSLFLFGFILYALCTDSLDIYVNVNDGDDSDSGLSVETSLKSLNAAQKMVRKIKSNYDEPININIFPGTYYESLHFTPLDSGTINSPITWQGINNGNNNVKISSGQQIDISSFYSCTSPLQKTKYPLKCVNLKSLNITNIGQMIVTPEAAWPDTCATNKSALFYNNMPQILARYPNINENNQMWVFRNINSIKNQQTFTWNDKYNDNNIEMWSKENDAYLHGYWSWDWADTYVKMDSITNSGNNIYEISSNNFGKGFAVPKADARFYGVNLLSELDTMKEFYIDKNSYILYWYPPTTTLENNIFLSIKEYGIYLNDSTSNLSFNNLTLEYNKITGIYGRNLKNINITNCNIWNSGKNGIDVEGYNLNILNNNIQYIGCIGISCVGGNYFTLTAANNIANHNIIYNFGRFKRTYQPGIFFGGVGNDYSYNNITFGPHNGFDGGGNEAQGCNNNFTYNLLQNTTFETSDSGSFYTCGQSQQAWINRGNIFNYNIVQNIRNLVPLANGQDATLNGIYLDDQMSGWQIIGNTFINIDRGIFIGGGRSNIVANNYCNYCDYCLHLDNRGMNWEKTSCQYPNGDNWKGLYSVNYTQPPWSIQYPQLQKITTNNTCIPIYNQFVNNEYCNGKVADFSPQNAQAWGDIYQNNTHNCH